jgi:hypothetical protein
MTTRPLHYGPLTTRSAVLQDAIHINNKKTTKKVKKKERARQITCYIESVLQSGQHAFTCASPTQMLFLRNAEFKCK